MIFTCGNVALHGMAVLGSCMDLTLACHSGGPPFKPCHFNSYLVESAKTAFSANYHVVVSLTNSNNAYIDRVL